MAKGKFPGTDLDKKLKNSERTVPILKKRFDQLTNFYELGHLEFTGDPKNPWFKLSLKLMKHLVPGFQYNKRGNKITHTLAGDKELYDLAEKLKNEAVSNYLVVASKKLKCSLGHAKHAIENYTKYLKSLNEAQENVDAHWSMKLVESDYAKLPVVPNRYTKNMKRKKN